MSNLKSYNILKYLEKEEYLKISDALYSPSKIMITVNNTESCIPNIGVESYKGNSFVIYPNPANDIVGLKITLDHSYRSETSAVVVLL